MYYRIKVMCTSFLMVKVDSALPIEAPPVLVSLVSCLSCCSESNSLSPNSNLLKVYTNNVYQWSMTVDSTVFINNEQNEGERVILQCLAYKTLRFIFGVKEINEITTKPCTL